MSSNNQFSTPSKVRPGDIYEVFKNRDEPVLSTTDFNQEINWASRSTVRRQLENMRASDKIRSKKAGDSLNAGEVWFPTDELEDIPQATPDPIKLIYRHQWFSLSAIGFFFIGFGFLLFMPGFFGQGQYLGIFSRDLLVQASLFLYISGVGMVTVASSLIIGKEAVSIIQSKW